MALSLAEARGVFTQTLLAAYKSKRKPDSFFTSFFKKTETADLNVSYSIQRSAEAIATDIVRGTTGNTNSFDKSSQKIVTPPMYSEMFNQTSLDKYDVAFPSNGTPNTNYIAALAMQVADKYVEIEDKVRRATELQCAQVLELGVISLAKDTINYKRKATSTVDISGTAPWSTAASDIEGQIKDAGDFLRQTGQMSGAEINMTISSTEWVYLKASTFFEKTANFRQVQLIDIKTPVASSTGASYMGTITAGTYTVHVWVYDGFYKNSSGVVVKYYDAKKAIFTPKEGTRFDIVYGGVDGVVRDGQNEFISRRTGQFIRWDYIDYGRNVHTFATASAPIAIPVSVDQIYTLKTLV